MLFRSVEAVHRFCFRFHFPVDDATRVLRGQGILPPYDESDEGGEDAWLRCNAEEAMTALGARYQFTLDDAVEYLDGGDDVTIGAPPPSTSGGYKASNFPEKRWQILSHEPSYKMQQQGKRVPSGYPFVHLGGQHPTSARMRLTRMCESLFSRELQAVTGVHRTPQLQLQL